jgi:hypothetical protein
MPPGKMNPLPKITPLAGQEEARGPLRQIGMSLDQNHSGRFKLSSFTWAASAQVRRCRGAGRVHRPSALLSILLQKSKVAGPRIFRENPKRKSIADSYDLNRIAEVACEFNVRR